MRRRIHASQTALKQLPPCTRLKKYLNKHTTRNKRPYPSPLSSPSSSKSPLEGGRREGGFPRINPGETEYTALPRAVNAVAITAFHAVRDARIVGMPAAADKRTAVTVHGKVIKRIGHRLPSAHNVVLHPGNNRTRHPCLVLFICGICGQFEKCKVRLVIQGQHMRRKDDTGVGDFEDAFSPVPHAIGFRTILSLATQHHVLCDHVDISQAFCLSSAKLRSTDSVNPRAVVSRVRPRYRLYSKHRDRRCWTGPGIGIRVSFRTLEGSAAFQNNEGTGECGRVEASAP